MIVVISGASGAGKSLLAAEISVLLRTRPASFGDYVRHLAVQRGLDAGERTVLQDLGEREVDRSPAAFVEDMLRWAERSWSEALVFDGLRHTAVRDVIFAVAARERMSVLHIHVNATRRVRAQRRTDHDLAALARLDAHPVEGDAHGALAKHADFIVDGGPAARRSAQRVAKIFMRRVRAADGKIRSTRLPAPRIRAASNAT